MAGQAGILPDPLFNLYDLQPLPTQYDFVSETLDLQSNTAAVLTGLVQRSLPGAEIISLRRFGNKYLWGAYQAEKGRIAEINNGNPNVKLLFHGTQEPCRILGNGLEHNCDGFDFRHSNGGSYGRGAYFAAEAAYPVKIFPRRKDPGGATFQVIIAEVSLGSVHDFGNECAGELTMPPLKRDGLSFNSVSGAENSIGMHRSNHLLHGKQFVVYERHQAYPHFLAVIRPDPILSCMRISIILAEPENGVMFLQEHNGWKLSCHFHEPSGDKRNDVSWKVILHRPAPCYGCHMWRLEDAGNGLHNICFAEDGPFTNWHLTCHAWEGCSDRRNDLSWAVVLHEPGHNGHFWRLQEVGDRRYHIVFEEPEGGDSRLRQYNGWRLSCQAHEPSGDKRNDESWFMCLHDPAIYNAGTTWVFDIVT